MDVRCRFVMIWNANIAVKDESLFPIVLQYHGVMIWNANIAAKDASLFSYRTTVRQGVESS